ncbi:MAG: hypothetical protein RLZZ09_3443, partial [Pseudomonadota bacterium]
PFFIRSQLLHYRLRKPALETRLNPFFIRSQLLPAIVNYSQMDKQS